MKTEAELFDFYPSELKPFLISIEEQKPDPPYVNRKLQFIIGIVITIIFTIQSIINKSIIFLIPVIFTAISLLFNSKKKIDEERYKLLLQEFNETKRKLYKIKVLPRLIDFLFDDCEYIPNQRISPVVLNKSMLIEHHISQVEGEGFMRFNVGETNIMFSETDALNDNLYSIFKGVFLSASFNKNFTSKTFLFSKSITAFIKNTEKKIFSGLEIVKLENNEFDHEFLVLSTDQVEARYILTPNLMERILDYKHKMGTNISFSFVDNRLYCAIPDYSYHFDPIIYSPLEYRNVKDVYNQLKIYTDIVEDLHLNLRIWSKE